MYSVLVIAVGLLRLTGTTVLPKSSVEVKERATPKALIFTPGQPPNLYRLTDGKVADASVPFTFQQIGPSGGRGQSVRDIPVVHYEMTDNSSVKVWLVEPDRRASPANNKRSIEGASKGTVHDVVGAISLSKATGSKSNKSLPIEFLAPLAKEIPDGEYQVAIIGSTRTTDTPVPKLSSEKWFSPRFKVQKKGVVKSKSKSKSKAAVKLAAAPSRGERWAET